MVRNVRLRPGMKTATTTLGLLALLGSLSLVPLGCASRLIESAGEGGAGDGGEGEGGDETETSGSGAGGPGDGLCGPLTDLPLDSLIPCCAEYGSAHCVDSVPADFQSLVAECPEGGYCVPDDFILKGAAVQPEKCASLGEADGRWVSGCIPQVAENAALLPTDEAHAGMFCVPCVNPLDGTDTGVCSLGTTCDGPIDGGGGSGGNPGTGATCDDPGPPIDPSLFAPCDNSCGGRCVDTFLLPNPNDPAIQKLGECAPGSGQVCVPEEFIASKGLGVPKTCDWYGLEGRCMSTCIPEIAEQAAQGFLIPADCEKNHLCTPCFDPITDEPTGACELTCDAGPDPAKPHDLPTCCGGMGTCVPNALAGDQAGDLGEDSCPDGSGLLCAPNDLMPGSSYVPSPCTPQFNFVEVEPGHDYGVCLPKCLPALDSFFLVDTGECGDNYACAPCWQPGFLGDEETDAPGCGY